LLISSLFKHRVYSIMLQIFLIAARVLVVGGLLFGVTQFIQGDLEVADPLAWLLIAGFAAFGGWGLLLLQLGALGEIWASIPFSVFLGVGLLLFVLAQALLTDGILALAVRRAERHE
jgi:membrane protease YdiL (CAAX protease family)